MTEQDFIKMHKAENDPAKQAIIHELVVKDRAAQDGQRKALEAQRARDGQVAVTCKCGAESVLDAKRPEKGPKAKCGVCGEAL